MRKWIYYYWLSL